MQGPVERPCLLVVRLPETDAAAAVRAAAEAGWAVLTTTNDRELLDALQREPAGAVALFAPAARADGFRLPYAARRAWPWVRFLFAADSAGGEDADLAEWGTLVRDPESPAAWRDALAACAAPPPPLRDWALRDPLTGLYNRRYVDELLAQFVSLATRHQQPLTLALLDLDGFRRVNEQQGHPGGDQVLCRVARTLAGAVRSSDVLARYGGDEFVLLLPQTGCETARSVVARLASTLAAAGGAETVPLPTFTAGLAALEPEGASPEALMARADEALHAAKRLR